MLLCTKTDSHGCWENVCATHGEAWTEWEPQAGEAHRDLHTNNHHTSLTHAHMDPCSPLLQEVEVSHYYFSSQVVLSVCDWDMVMRNIRCGASMWKCLKTPRDLRELITANYRDEAQQLELPRCHSKTGSAPLAHQWPPGFYWDRNKLPLGTSPLIPLAPRLLAGPDLYLRETARWLRACWNWYELA